jgi:hypothetical protein
MDVKSATSSVCFLMSMATGPGRRCVISNNQQDIELKTVTYPKILVEDIPLGQVYIYIYYGESSLQGAA